LKAIESAVYDVLGLQGQYARI